MPVHDRAARPRVTVWTSDDLTSAIELDADVVGFTVRATQTAPGQQWSVTLLPRQSVDPSSPANIQRLANLYQTLRPNMVVSIGMERRGGITMGLIDSVQKSVVHVGAITGYGLVVSGSGMGKVLTQDNIIKATLTVQDLPAYTAKVAGALGFDNPTLADLPGVWGPSQRDGVPTFIAQSVPDVIAWALSKVSSMRIPVLARGGTGKPGDYFRTDKCLTTWFAKQVWSDGPQDYQGSAWGFIQSILDPDFYECWVDTVPIPPWETELWPGLPDVHLIVRPKPFDESGAEWAEVKEDPGIGWDSLTTLVEGLQHHDIDRSEVFSEQLGFSDADAFSYFNVTSQHDLIGNAESANLGLFYPLVDLYLAQRHGLRRYDSRLTLVGGDIKRRAGGDGDYTTEVSEAIHEARNRLFNWYRANPWFENGTIQVVGRDNFRPGDPVRLAWALPPIGTDVGMRYYCTGVSWSWQWGGHYLSTLQLNRGHNGAMLDAIDALVKDEGEAIKGYMRSAQFETDAKTGTTAIAVIRALQASEAAKKAAKDDDIAKAYVTL